MWMYAPGKSAHTSSYTCSMNRIASSLPAQRTSSCTPLNMHGTRGSPSLHANSGCAARSARVCPGTSISGTTVMKRSFA